MPSYFLSEIENLVAQIINMKTDAKERMRLMDMVMASDRVVGVALALTLSRDKWH